MAELQLRPATPADLDGVTALLAATFPANPKADPQVAAWQHWSSPFGATRAWVWEAGGEIVAHWAAVPVPVRLDGEVVVGAKGVDIAVRPDYQGGGLFRRLAARLVTDLAEAGVPVLLSHPNPRSLASVRDAGGVPVRRPVAAVLPLEGAWLAQRLRLPRLVADRVVRLAARRLRRRSGRRRAAAATLPPAGLDALWAACAAGHRFGIDRGRPWWTWRYAERPGDGYRAFEVRGAGGLEGAAVTVTREAYGASVTYLLELLATDAAAAAALVHAAAAAATEEGAVALTAAAIRGRQARWLRRAGLWVLPKPLEPRPLQLLVVAPAGGSAELARAPWRLSWGDLDHL